ILRCILISKQDYISHLQAISGHDQSRIKLAELVHFDTLPEHFWMVEFSLPPLYTGNRSKLGEVLLSVSIVPDPTNIPAVFLGMRIPKTLIKSDGTGGVL